jgi:hypothetical protein
MYVCLGLILSIHQMPTNKEKKKKRKRERERDVVRGIPIL